MARYYNQRVRNTQFRVGDLVLRNNEAIRAGQTGKLEAKWEGSYQVEEVLRKGSYKLLHPNGEVVPRTWHISNLHRYYL